VEGYLRRGEMGGGGGGLFDVQLVGDMARSLARGDLGKARRMGGLAAALAIEGVAALGLDQRRWGEMVQGAREEGDGRGVGCMAGKVLGEGKTEGGEKEKKVVVQAMAVNIIRGLVRNGDVGLVRELLQVVENRGVEKGEAVKALVQCCHGDSQLMEVVRQVLQGRS
jgi:hypothetical protein